MPVLDGDFEAFVTNLGKYNEGELVGEWVKFPTTEEEMQKVFERIGIGSKDEFGQPYEEWFITDYECPIYGVQKMLGEYESLDKLNYLAALIDELSQSDQEKLVAIMEAGGDSWDRQFDGSLDDIPDEYRLTGSAESQERDGKLTVVVVEPEKAPRIADVGSDLKSLQDMVGGYIEAIYPFDDPVAIVCNEEAKLEGLPLNRALRDEDGDIYCCRDIYDCGVDGR